MERLGKRNSPFIHRGNLTSGIPELSTAPNSELWVVFNLNKELSALSRAASSHSHPAELQHFLPKPPQKRCLEPQIHIFQGMLMGSPSPLTAECCRFSSRTENSCFNWNPGTRKTSNRHLPKGKNQKENSFKSSIFPPEKPKLPPH